jgi:hypothetical protein
MGSGRYVFYELDFLDTVMISLLEDNLYWELVATFKPLSSYIRSSLLLRKERLTNKEQTTFTMYRADFPNIYSPGRHVDAFQNVNYGLP